MLGYKTRRFCVRARQRLSSRGRRSGDHRVWALHLKIVQAAKSRAAFCVRFMPALRSCGNALRSITPAVCRIAPNRTACGRLRSYSAVGRDRRSCVLGLTCGYRTWLVHFGFARFLAAIPTEYERDEGTRGTRNGVGGAAWARFCASILALPCFPRGVRWGEMWKPHCGRAPKPAPRSQNWKPHCGLPGLSSFGSRQSAFHAARGARV